MLCMTGNLRKRLPPPPQITSYGVKQWKALCNALSRCVCEGLATIVEIVQKRFIEEI